MTSERVPSSSKLTNSPYSLQRGKACSNCRKRKIKCDGLRPTCTQCLKSARPGDACEYADSGRTRTQMLEDNISRLEARIRELEEPNDEDAVRLYAPYNFSGQSSPNLMVPPSTASSIRSGSALSSPTDPQRSSNSPSISSSPGHSSTYSAFPEEPSSDVVQQLLTTFLPHALDMGFFLHVSRFKTSASLPLPLGHYSRPCAGLLSTVYLIGLHLTGDDNNQENVYLARALAHTANMLSSPHPQRIIHAIQAEVLLSVYFFRTGRILEGKYHMSAAVSLTLGAQLHKIRALPTGIDNSAGSPLQQISVAGPLLTPPNDQIEEGERINAFWMVYTLSNCWGVAVGTLSSAVFENHGSTIDTPWPLDMADYEQVMWNTLRESWTYGSDVASLHPSQELLPTDHQSVMTVQNFLRRVPSSSVKEFSTMAMFAKASILLDRAVNLASFYRSVLDMGADEASRFGATFSSLENLINNFQSNLGFLPLNQHTFPYEFSTILTTHSLAYTATIQLHSVFINANSHSRSKALSAARACVSILRQVDMRRLSHINAVLSSCWTSVCQVLIDEIRRTRRIIAATGGTTGIASSSRLHPTRTGNWGLGEGGLQGTEEEMQLVELLEKVFATMAVFSIESPLIGYQLAKVQEAFHSI
ncbi:Zn(2)-Cys(6) binuclear cluster domain-containing protein [Lentinula detonsa]|uniref:Zn(2)-Cys(6) binuclear cluster domain-containing protein n=1 Tax=Lentinula detonsa TaxID=2804962 RepID=A0AA38PZG3_9AGAR|nr:Zn(2)-Cys(6) binuclear cluster domain-containing protein [Lentinula detonsa]